MAMTDIPPGVTSAMNMASKLEKIDWLFHESSKGGRVGGITAKTGWEMKRIPLTACHLAILGAIRPDLAPRLGSKTDSPLS